MIKAGSKFFTSGADGEEVAIIAGDEVENEEIVEDGKLSSAWTK
jgi:hypothetical protein